jgi:hypothetical protein
MTNAKNRKLCWNCDGSVHIHATKCPFCGTELVAEEAPPTQQTFQQTYQQPEPPPQPVSQEPPPPPYVQRVQSQSYALPQQSSWQEQLPEEESKPAPEPRARGDAMPLLMLLPGAFFFLFAMLLLLFSEDGLLTLSWQAKHWFVYFLVAMPLLYLGWRSLNRVTEPESV